MKEEKRRMQNENTRVSIRRMHHTLWWIVSTRDGTGTARKSPEVEARNKEEGRGNTHWRRRRMKMTMKPKRVLWEKRSLPTSLLLSLDSFYTHIPCRCPCNSLSFFVDVFASFPSTTTKVGVKGLSTERESMTKRDDAGSTERRTLVGHKNTAQLP